MQILIKDTAVAQRQAKGYTFRTQEGWTNLNGEVRRVPISLDDQQLPYEVGNYSVGDASFYFGDYGRLMLGRLQLLRVAEGAAVRPSVGAAFGSKGAV